MIFTGPAGDVQVSTLRQLAQPPSAYSPSLIGDSYAGRTVSREAALGISAFLACVGLLSETGGTLPVLTRDMRSRGAVVEQADVALRIRYQPNPDTTAATFWTSLLAHVATVGNAYYLKLPASDELTTVPEMWLLSPEHVTKYRDRDRVIRYDIIAPDGAMQLRGVHHRHVTHVRGWSLGSGFLGMSKIGVQRHRLGIELAAQEYEGRTLRNSATPQGVLSIDEVLQDGQATTIRDQWQATYGGASNAGRIAVLDRGAKFQPVSMNNRDLQFIESRKASATEIASWHHIAPAMIGAEGASFQYQNANHNDRHFMRYALRPLLRFAEEALNHDPDLFGIRSPWVPAFDRADVIEPDTETNWRMHGQAVRDGLMTPATGAERLGLPIPPQEAPQ